MTSSAQLKGDKAEREVVSILRDAGWVHAQRGRTDPTGDRCDITGVPDCTIEVKNYKNITLGVNVCLKDLDVGWRNKKSTFAAGFVRLPGGKYVVVMTPEMWATYQREATQ